MGRILVFLILFFIFSTSGVRAQVVINEIQMDPDQWIELYNKGDSNVDLSNWSVDDDGGTQKYLILGGIILQPKKCITFQSGNFNWNTATADDVRLFDSSNNLIESYHYESSPGLGISIGRATDGEGGLVILQSGSRDHLNLTGELCLVPTPTPTPTSTPTPTPSPSPSPTATPTPTPTLKPTSTAKPTMIAATKTVKPSATPNLELARAALASPSPAALGESTQSGTISQNSKFPFLTVVCVLVGVGCIGSAFWYNKFNAQKGS